MGAVLPPMGAGGRPTGGIRVYNFSVDDFKGGQEERGVPNAPAGFTYPSQNQDGSGPADFEGASAIKRRLNKFAPRVGAAATRPARAGRHPRQATASPRARPAEVAAQLEQRIAVVARSSSTAPARWITRGRGCPAATRSRSTGGRRRSSSPARCSCRSTRISTRRTCNRGT